MMASMQIYQHAVRTKKQGRKPTIASSDEGWAARLELETVDEQMKRNNVSSSASRVVLVSREPTINTQM
jgi:hypothetical protein